MVWMNQVNYLYFKMNDLNKFYYDILNIRKPSVNYNLIKEIVNKKTNELLKRTNDISGLCKVIALFVLEELNKLNIRTLEFNIKDLCELNYEHVFLISYYKENDEIKYILIDPTYTQFVKTKGFLNPKFNAWPSEILSKTEKGTKILESLVGNGCSLVENEDVNLYLNSFGSVVEEFNLEKSFITHSKKY